jgi:hypothetical protein
VGGTIWLDITLINAEVVKTAYCLDKHWLKSQWHLQWAPEDPPMANKQCKTVFDMNSKLGQVKVECISGIIMRQLTRKWYKQVIRVHIGIVTNAMVSLWESLNE